MNTLEERMLNAEQYKCVCISTEDCTEKDLDNLKHLDSGMVMERDTGFFIKLYEEPEYNMMEFQHLSTPLNAVLKEAHELGFRMVEIDCDAEPVTLQFDDIN